MAKIRETFRLVVEGSVTSPKSDNIVSRTADSDTNPDGEMPFIEIGPHREVTGSPDVLACPGPRVIKEVQAPPQEKPRTHTQEPMTGVAFRNLPAGPRLAGLTARQRFAAELVAFHAPGQPASAIYADLLSTLLDSARDRTGPLANVFMLTGIRSQVGVTTVLLNLAITAARQDRRVIVIDANLRHPCVADRLGVSSQPGLSELLTGEISLDAAIRPTDQENLFVITSGSPRPLWADPQSLNELLGQLSSQGDIIFLDAPYWDGRFATNSLASASGAVFLVVPGTEVDQAPASDLARRLPAQGIPLAGCILTAA